MQKEYIYIYLFVFLLSGNLACNFGGTKNERYYGDPAEHLRNKTYNDFYDREGRAPRNYERSAIDHWADSLRKVGGIINNSDYSVEYGTKETREKVLKKKPSE